MAIPTTATMLSGQESLDVLRRMASGITATPIKTTGGNTGLKISAPATGLLVVGKNLVFLKKQTLIGPDATSAGRNRFGGTYTASIATKQVSGEVISITAYSQSQAPATIIRQAFNLHLFDSNPNIPSGLTSLSTTNAQRRVGTVVFSASDWAVGWGTGSAGGYKSVAVPFITNSTGQLFLSVRHGGTQTWNKAGGDNQTLKATIAFRLDN